ncbi:hypothetical protein ANANG_G00025580 [Anguilla anguilla]|uniref:Uncharacterized protein n=1 Tax=Anguilla anguilla TaxID=7936 RepID=A0A9D3SCD3_ANGAN|nr:hypothetical protein ANANG_G00025580 [Anguilla anguilla]
MPSDLGRSWPRFLLCETWRGDSALSEAALFATSHRRVWNLAPREDSSVLVRGADTSAGTVIV